MNFSRTFLFGLGSLIMIGCQFNESSFSLNNDASMPKDAATLHMDSNNKQDAMNTGLNRGLLARYRINEAITGQTPTMLIDDSGSDFSLPLEYIQGSPSFGEDNNGNRFLRFSSNDADDTGGAKRNISGSTLAAIHGATEATLSAKYSVDACADTDHRIFGFSDSGVFNEAGWFLIREDRGVEFLAVRWSGSTTSPSYYRLAQDCPFADPRLPGLVHWVVDTMEIAAEDRVRAYIDGVQQVVSLNTLNSVYPSLGATIDLTGVDSAAPSKLLLGNPAVGFRTANLRIAYAAVFGVALTEEEILGQAASIAVSDD